MAPLIAAKVGKYRSVRNNFIAKSPKIINLESKINRNVSDIKVHNNITDDLDADEEDWLAELLTWEEQFPNKKDKFLGKRPRDVKAQAKVNNCELLPCYGCKLQFKNELDDQCPLLRVVSCNHRGHPDYKIRYGRENFDGPGCPICRKDFERQELERKERERKEIERKEVEQIEKDKRDGWIFIENWKG